MNFYQKSLTITSWSKYFFIIFSSIITPLIEQALISLSISKSICKSIIFMKNYYVIYILALFLGSKNVIFSSVFRPKLRFKPLYVVVNIYFFSPEPLRVIRIIASTWLVWIILITKIAHIQPICSIETVNRFCLFDRCSRPNNARMV